MTGWYPYRIPAYGVNTFLSWIGFDGEKPNWMSASPNGDLPGIVLNVSNRYHRKNFYFLKAFWRETMKSPLARYMKTALQEGDTFIDVGAHIGFYSWLAARLVGQTGNVFAFDPEPMTYESLCRSAEINGGRVQVRGVGLADEPGELPFFRAIAQAHSLVPSDADPRYTGEAIKVPITTLDAWSREENLDLTRIKLLKVDVEGAEARTIAGALTMLKDAGRPAVWCEVRGPEGSKRAPSTFGDVMGHLRALGYKAYRWNESGVTNVDVQDVRGREDILFRADAS
jgi:FkbM family methyltransferase